jgi:Ca-activated chloride channel family protein
VSEFQFAEPQYIHGIWPVLMVVAGLAWLERRGGHALGRFVGPALQGRLVSRPTRLRRSLRIVLLAISALCLVAALMRPQWGVEFITAPRVGAEIMIALDVSKSMLAEDVAPNRLERAKAEIRDLLAYLEGDQVGLIAFAGRASVLCPLTPDFSFLRLVLDNTHVGSVRRGGTRLEEPIRKATQGFGAAGDLARVILLITDGEDHDSFPVDAAKAAAERGIKILAVGFGDEDGSPITLTDPDTSARSVLRDADGRPVISRLDGALLRELAVATEGVYIPAGTGVLDLESIFEAHIRPLMRAEGEERGRTVRKEAFQWAVFLALLALLGNVAIKPTRTSVGAAVLLALALQAPTPGWAATLQGSPRAPHGSPPAPPAGLPVAPEAMGPDQESDEDRSRLELPEDPREAYNRGLELLDGGALDALEDAERLFEAARSRAGSDGETRFRATYNLGWVDVKRADERLESDPQAALTALERSADWFREAVGLRPKNQPARRNLEIVLQRALVLADSLAQNEPRDIAARLAELIAGQRAVAGPIRGLVERVSQSRDDPNAVDAMRPQFRRVAVEERKILSEAGSLAQLAGEELDALQELSEEELSPEDRMRSAQLSGLLHHLHRGRERIGQARSQLRRRQAERAYRRAASGLSALKRARDQLLDPVRLLDTILADAGQLSTETRGLAVASSTVSLAAPSEPGDTSPPEAPAWLTTRYLGEAQEDVAQRTEELHLRLQAGLDQAGGVADPEQLALLEQVGEAEPFVAEAHSHFARAFESLEAEQVIAAAEAQIQGIAALIQARERFLDLKGLIEAAYADEKRIDELMDPASEGALGEYAEALSSFQQHNLERARRMTPLLEREREKLEEPIADTAEDEGEEEGEEDNQAREVQLQRLALAKHILTLTESAMQSAVEELGKVAISPTSETSAVSAGAARNSVEEAVEGLANLRRIFFSIIEHLRDTAERQVELNDQSEDAAALAAAEPERTGEIAAPLAARQGQLGKFTEQLAQALHEQSFRDPSEMAGGATDVDPAAAKEMTQRLTQASELVLLASEDMKAASEGLSAEAPEFEALRQEQDAAVEKLAEALTLLQPEDQQQQCDQGQQQQEQQQQEQGQQPSEQDQEKQDQQQKSGQGADQLLQSIRDREAERQRTRGERGQQRYESVERDW